MEIWGAMLIPIIAVLILGFKFNKKLVWWEYVLIVALPALMIWGAKSICEASMVHCTEYWGSYLVRAEYHEHWNEYIHRTCTRCGGYDDKGNCDDWETYDCSYVDDHPQYWAVFDKAGNSWHVRREDFDRLCELWAPRTFVKLHNPCYTICGDMYVTNLPVTFNDGQLFTTTTAHSYENRIQASHSIFNYKEISKKDVKLKELYEHPSITGWHQDSVLGDAGPTKQHGEYFIGKVNGLLGASCKARFVVLMFKNKPIEISYEQEAYWKGGNKNEIEICIGIDNEYHPTWVRVFGWSKQEELKISIRDYIMKQKKLELGFFGDWLYGQVEGKIVRRDFREFKYLTVDPPAWVIMLVYFLTLAMCIGIGWFEVVNDVAGSDGYSRYPMFRRM